MLSDSAIIMLFDRWASLVESRCSQRFRLAGGSGWNIQSCCLTSGGSFRFLSAARLAPSTDARACEW